MPTLEQRFWSKVEKTATCWLWRGALTHNGYGHLATCLNNRKVRAHRLAYELLVDEIPKGKQVLHTCDNRRCVNPKHLFVGTAQDNIDDMVAKGRQRVGKHERKLTAEQIAAIKADQRSSRKIAADYNVCHFTILKARNAY